jgi:hypothetical protein
MTTSFAVAEIHVAHELAHRLFDCGRLLGPS